MQNQAKTPSLADNPSDRMPPLIIASTRPSDQDNNTHSRISAAAWKMIGQGSNAHVRGPSNVAAGQLGNATSSAKSADQEQGPPSKRPLAKAVELRSASPPRKRVLIPSGQVDSGSTSNKEVLHKPSTRSKAPFSTATFVSMTKFGFVCHDRSSKTHSRTVATILAVLPTAPHFRVFSRIRNMESAFRLTGM